MGDYYCVNNSRTRNQACTMKSTRKGMQTISASQTGRIWDTSRAAMAHLQRPKQSTPMPMAARFAALNVTGDETVGGGTCRRTDEPMNRRTAEPMNR